jgi:uncharacterized protein YutE (UPF0331/DUF86 family)
LADKNLILAKASAVRRHLKRVRDKSDIKPTEFLKDPDRQDIIIFNLQMAIQNCIDIAAHLISAEGMGMPAGASEMFLLLAEHGYLNQELAEKMIKTVGFRNLLVHEYSHVDLKRVFDIARQDILDLNDYLKSIFTQCGISES